VDDRAQIEQAACVECGSCADACPQGAIAMATSASVADPVIQPQEATRAPAPVMTSAQACDLAYSPVVEVFPSESRRGRVWPVVGGAVMWAARELLPEVIAAWRASQPVGAQPTNRQSVMFGQVSSRRSRTSHRHRWGRA
jgi:ferredoxin